MTEWIKCSDRLPEERTSVLAFVKIGFYFSSFDRNDDRSFKQCICFYEKNEKDLEWREDCGCSGYECDPERIEPIYWMPLPKPPENI